MNQGPRPCTDAGDRAVVVDQRGEPRPVGLRSDIGAFEGDFVGIHLAPILLLLE